MLPPRGCAGRATWNEPRGEVDRRRVLVELTDEDRRLHRRMSAHQTRHIVRLFGSRLSDENRRAVRSASGELLA